VIDRASFEPESLDREAPFRARLRSVR
jgi:hypothetical protein